MAYTNIDDPSAHFQAFTYTGTGSNNSITLNGNSNLQPDLYWYKSRPNTNYHYLVDSSRGTTKYIYPNDALAEGTVASAYVTSFDTNGVTLGGGDSGTNTNGNSFANWVWKANGGTVTTTPNGTQTTNNMQMATKHQINSDAGFSICTYQGATSYGSFYHGLGVKPDVVIIKSRTDAYDWVVYHKSLTNTHTLYLNSSSAGSTNTAFFPAEPNTTQVYCKDHNSVFRPNGADSYLAYCFAEKQGYSKFGKYIANANTNGPFVYTGFKPAFVIVKKSSGTGNWLMYDNKRGAFNLNDEYVYANEASAEATSSTSGYDFLSNGFKVRNTYNDGNVSGQTYIYMAFAENPFTTSTGIPTTAR